MAALYFYLCFILKLTLVTGQSVHYVLKGREAVLSPALSSAPDDILWKHNGDKVITFDSAEERVFPPYEGRVTLGWGTAELTIADVRYEDSGEYELDVFIRERLYRSQYILKVLDKVSKPAIRCEMNDESSNSTSATLRCSSDSNTPEALTFKWNLEGKSQLGQALAIALGNKHDHIEYSCTATNPLHAETNIFMAKDCYTEKSSGALDIVVPIVIASLILLALCIFPIIFRHQIKRACLKLKKNDDLEKQMKAAETDNNKEGTPLMGEIHRQETLASKQPLIQQTDYVRGTPQRQEITQELEELRSSKKVQKRSKRFSNHEHAESQPDTMTEEEIDTDNVETATPQPASPIRTGQVDSDTDLSRQEINTAPISEGGSDANSKHSSEYEDASETIEQQSQSPSSDPRDLRSMSGEHERRRQSDSEEGPDVQHSDHEGVTKASNSSSVHSGQEETPEEAEFLHQPHLQSSVTKEDEHLQTFNKGLAESTDQDQEPQKDPSDEKEPVLPGSDPATTASQQPASPPQPLPRRNAPVLHRDSPSKPVETASENKNPDEKPETRDPENRDRQAGDQHEKSVFSEQKGGSESPLQSPSHSSRPGDKDSPSGPDEFENKKATDPDENSNTSDKKTPENPSHHDSPPSESTPAESGESGETKEQQSTSESSESQPQSPRSSSDQDSKPEPGELKDQKTSPETKPDAEDKDPHDSDHENVSSGNKTDQTGTEEIGVKPPPSDSKPSEANSASSQSNENQNQDSGLKSEEARCHEELDSSTDNKQLRQDSSSQESEESKQTSTTEQTPSADSDQPEAQSPSSDPQDLLPKSDEHEGSGQTDRTDSEDESDVHHSDSEGAPKTIVAADSSSTHSGQEEDAKTPEHAGSQKASDDSTRPPASALSPARS